MPLKHERRDRLYLSRRSSSKKSSKCWAFSHVYTVAESLEVRICNLILELLTHTFGRLCALPAAGTVSAGALESFPDGIDNLLIGIELDFHVRHLFLDRGFIIPQDKSFLCDEVTLIKKSGAFFSTGFLRG